MVVVVGRAQLRASTSIKESFGICVSIGWMGWMQILARQVNRAAVIDSGCDWLEREMIFQVGDDLSLGWKNNKSLAIKSSLVTTRRGIIER